ncbi:MAG TPA: IS4 family transposase [Thermoanaerobaculia bacterium]|nr:IS4 family transposase [Thermoanaerobaculia bacterium]
MEIGQALGNLETRDRFSIEALTDVIRPEWVAEALAGSGVRSKRIRRLPMPLVVWIVVLLGLFRRLSLENLLERLQGGFWTTWLWQGKTPTDSALIKARDALGWRPMQALFRRSAREWSESHRAATLFGRRLVAIDGSTLKVPDSPENRGFFGLPGTTRGRPGYPLLRVATALDIGTRLFLAEAHGPFRTGEIDLARRLLGEIPVGSLVLLDRNFNAHDFLWDLRQRGCDFIVRAKTSFIRSVRVLRTLSTGEDLVEWTLPSYYEKERPDMPRTVVMRLIRFRIGDGEEIRLLTSILDPELKKEEIAMTYHLRWEQETAIDELKHHLCDCATVTAPTALRSRTPARIEQELYGLLIAYNATRAIMADSAAAVAKDPCRLSFVGALERVREAIHEMARLPVQRLRPRYERLLRTIAAAEVPARPGRSAPRAVKVKYSSYPVLRQRRAA